MPKKKKQNKPQGETLESGDKVVDTPQTNSSEPAKNGNAVENEPPKNSDAAEPASKNKKKKKKPAAKTEDKESKDKSKRKPNKAMLALMKEQLAKKKEEEERFQKEEEERIKQEEEAEKKRLEELERERLKKEKKKQLKKDRIKRQKQEGTYKSAAQKEQEKRNAAFLETLKQQGRIATKADGETTKKPKYVKQRKQVKKPVVENVEEKMEKLEIKEPVVEDENEESEEEDDWELKADEIDEESTVTSQNDAQETDDDEESDEEQPVPVIEKKKPVKESPEDRIANRKAAAEAKRSVDNLRAPVICVMGHVDTGKTKILDKLRHTNVQDGEAGGITQQIGATNVPISAIQEQTKMVNNFDGDNMKIPGLLIIDTPGHESFSNLRSRGSSNCDMAILVVDIMHGLEPQTIESIKMLKKRKVPFVIALNKVDRLYQWESHCDSDVTDVIRTQNGHVKDEFKKRVNQVVVEFAKEELNVKLFYENDDPKTWISMIPTSAHSGDGMGNLMAQVVTVCQTFLAKRLAFSEELQCTVLEVKNTPGLGTTLDVLLINGSLKYGDQIVIAGQERPIVTHIKGLLMPEPMKEFRVKNQHTQHSKVVGAQGVRITAKDLDKALAGTALLVAHHEDEIEILTKEAQEEVDAVLKNIKVSDKGVYVQASTLGSLEALLEYLRTSKIPYSGINIGPVHKRDVVRASVMLQRDEQWAVIMAFDVKVEREAQEHAEHEGVRIFSADIIYHLTDAFTQHREDMKKMKQAEFSDRAVFPCKLKIIPENVFMTRSPIVVGVRIESGQLHLGTPLCVMKDERVSIGKVTSIQYDHKSLEHASTNDEVCIKIESPPGAPPKLIGRHFEITDDLFSEITRDSIDILKEWFRDKMSKADWQLIIELKKKFEIL